MVFHLPNQNTLRQSKTYTQMFYLTLVWNVGLLGIVVTGLFIIFFILKKYQLRMVQNQMLKDSMITAEQGSQRGIVQRKSNLSQISQLQEEEQGKLPLKTIKNPTTKFFKVINVLTSIFFYIFWIVVSLIYLAFYMFNFFGRGNYVDVLSVFAMTVLVVIPTLIWKYYTKVSAARQLRGEIVATVILLAFWLVVSVFLVITMKGVCLCYFTDGYGFKIEKSPALTMSTDFMRIVSLDQVCQNEQVCHLYATLPADTSTSVFFNAHSGLTLDNLTFVLSLQNKTVVQKISSQPYRMDNVESIGQRNVHSILMTGLTQDTFYYLQVKDPNGKVLKEIGYKTLPGRNAKTLRIAAGGDLGMTQEGKLMTSYLKDFNPDVVILGGDTVYDNGLRTCYYNWDMFYSMFKPVYVHLDRLVPLVMSIGNHDVGFDALDPVQIQSTLDYIPLFFLYNPQHLSKDGKGVPPILQRLSSHYHVIGSTIHFNLDSGYIQTYKEQVKFIEDAIKSNPNHYLFANYHNPIFPACANQAQDSNDAKVINEGTQNWLPLFDKWNFTAVLEHHTHYRKMSYRMKNATKDELGTRYIGDGSWGVPNQTCSTARTPPYMDVFEDYSHKEPNHYWQLTLTKVDDPQSPYQINYTAVDMGHKMVINKVDSLLPAK